MALFVIFGILLALGHHLYYASLNGTTAGSASRQQWPIRFGTAFAYLVTSCLNAAVGLAFTQQLWRSVRQKSFSIASLDKMFGITTDPTSFRSWQVLSRAKVVTFLALVAWVLPFAGIIPPATLTVDTVPYPQVKKMAFGIPNWSSRSLITPAIDNTATVPSDVMLRLALQTGLRSQILPIEAPATNSSFGLVFFGPTMRCKAPNDAQKTAFDYYVARIRNESGIFVATDIDDVNAIQQKDPTAPAVSLIYSAFSPRFSEMVNDPSVDATYNGWVPELGSFSPSNPLRPGVLQDALLQELWIQLSDQSIVCQLANASFDVHIQNLNGAQTVTFNSVQALPEYNQTYLENSDSDCSDWDNEAYCTSIKLNDPQMSYIGWYGALANLLNGNVTLNTGTGDASDYNHTTNMLQQTGLTSCPELSNNWWTIYCQEVGASLDFCNSLLDDTTNFFPEEEPYLCRNGTLARAIEDLANNITVSLLSNRQLPWGSSVEDINSTSFANHGIMIPVTITSLVNLYTYDWRNLVISYAIAAAFALGAATLGGLAFRQNGVGHVSSFSAIVATTRNHDLDALMEGQCLGAVPLSEDVSKTKLRCGLVGPTTEKVRHVAFGLEHDVQTLQNGDDCS